MFTQLETMSWHPLAMANPNSRISFSFPAPLLLRHQKFCPLQTCTKWNLLWTFLYFSLWGCSFLQISRLAVAIFFGETNLAFKHIIEINRYIFCPFWSMVNPFLDFSTICISCVFTLSPFAHSCTWTNSAYITITIKNVLGSFEEKKTNNEITFKNRKNRWITSAWPQPR